MSILVLQMFPAFLSMTAIYILLSKMNLIDTYIGLLLVYVTGSLPFMTWLVKGYFDAIPTSLDEAAKIDGAGHLTIFLKLYYRLLNLFSYLWHWFHSPAHGWTLFYQL